MKLVTSAAIWLCVIGMICLPSEIICCTSGTYYSLDLDGCLECPESPVSNCKGEHQKDIRSCLENCVTGSKNITHRISKQPTTFATMSVPENEASKATPTSKQPTTLVTLSTHENKTFPTLSTRNHKVTSKVTSLSEQPKTLATFRPRKNETSKVASPSKQPTTLVTVSARENKTSKPAPLLKQPTTLTTLGNGKRNTIKEQNSPSKQSRKPKTSEHSAIENSDKNRNRRSYVGAIKLDHFLVLLCVLALGTLAIIYTIITCRRQSRRPEVVTPSCAGYILVFSAEGPESGSYDEQPPAGSIQLTVINT